jgi:hypothetical protein
VKGFWRSPECVLAFIVCVSIPQFVALTAQFERGFRPFLSEPSRVPFSWDMFSNRVERCAVRWEPPGQWHGKELSALSDLIAPLEWDPVFDHADTYRRVAEEGCREKTRVPGRAVVTCFFPDGTWSEDEYRCPS